MTIHYHGADINPISVLQTLTGRHFCVSYAYPAHVARAHQMGQSVMLDNGAFSLWRSGKQTDWPGFYAWAERWLYSPTTWAVIPDEIDAGTQVQDSLIAQWPFGKEKGAPVWHMDEPLHRLLRLVDEWPLVCIGSTSEFAVVLSDSWQSRMDVAFNEISRGRRFMPRIHMLRGMACCGNRWPFASVDSTDIARNHHRAHNNAKAMADKWDAQQCARAWEVRASQDVLID